MRLSILLIFFTLLSSVNLLAQPPLISLHDGKLVYNRYANRGQQDSVNQIPDFSNAGYKGGGIAIPTVAIKKTIQPIEGDCRALIQDAIDSVAALPADANGQRGAILLKAGIYPVEGSLFIRAGGVVLRGEGNGLTGTVLIATLKTQHNFIVLQGTGSGYAEVSGSRVKIASAYVPTGAKTLAVANNHSFQPGDNVVIQKTPTEAWIDTLDMRQFGWTASAYRSTYERQVKAVQGNTITLDIPIVDPLEQFYGGGDVFKSAITGRIQECGVENLRIESFFASNDDENHGWNAVVLNRAENCWTRNVIVKFFGYAAVNLTNMSRFNTVEDCAMIDPKSVTTGGRKYSFIIDGNATGNLIQRCMTWGGRHDYVTGSKVPGPNVFLDCISENTFADIGPHHRWGTGQLYDNVYGGQIRVQNRGASGTGHGWSGAQILFWNCHSFKSDIEVESPPTAMNWGIGCVGVKQTNTGYWESWGTPVLPRSLYLQQLEERLGVQAVRNITTPDQVQGILRDLLRSRAVQLSTEPKVSYGEEPPPSDSFDITDNGGTITAQYSNTSKPSENFPSLIDNSTTTKYYQSGRKALWVQYQSSVTAVVVKYTITSANDVPERDPKNWLLLASNDGVTWDTLDTRAGETFATRFLTKTYVVNNATSYIHYRLSITSNNGHSGTQFAEWELYQRKHQTITLGDIPDMTYGDEPVELIASATSGLPVAFEIADGPATLNEGFLTITGAGTITVRARQAGDENYFPADTVEKIFLVRKAIQVITFEAIPPKKVYDDVTLVASSSSGLPVLFDVISGPGILAGNILSFTAEGIVTVEASQPGDGNHLAASTAEQAILVDAPGFNNDGVKLIVAPNPTFGKSVVIILGHRDRQYFFTVYNNSGSIVPAPVIPRHPNVYELDLSANIAGIYYLLVADGTLSTVTRILKW